MVMLQGLESRFRSGADGIKGSRIAHLFDSGHEEDGRLQGLGTRRRITRYTVDDSVLNMSMFVASKKLL